MADLSFDVVIVGGGGKGLATGIYLAKYGGMSVGIFEELHELGGAFCGEQIAPGIQHNNHSFAEMSWYYDIVIKDDIPELWDEGFKQVGSSMNSASLFPDGTCLATYGVTSDPDGSRSAAQIARFSQKDAETFMKLRKIWLERLRPAFYEEMFTLPLPGEPTPMQKVIMTDPEIQKAGLNSYVASMSARHSIPLFFESDQMKIGLLRLNQTQGFSLDEAGTGLLTLLLGYESVTHAAVRGGIHNLTHAMHRVLYRYGAQTFTHSGVDKVLIENGVAKGIRLKNGAEIEAKKAVISTLSPRMLCYDLIGSDHLSPDILRKIDALESHRTCLNWFGWAFTEYPKFKAHDFNPDIDSEEFWDGVTYFTMGGKEVRDLEIEAAYRKMYQPPPNPLVILTTQPRKAQLTPEGTECLAIAEDVSLPAWAYPEDWWIKYQHEHAEFQMRKLQEFMVDMSWDKVLGVIPVTPYYMAKHLPNMAPSGNANIIDYIPCQMPPYRPIPELAYHRTPIKNLYATGSGFGNWGMSSLCGAYTCYKIMADDYGLRKSWEEQGRPY